MNSQSLCITSKCLGDSLTTPCLDRSDKQYVVASPFVNEDKVKIIHFERVDGPLTLFRLEELERVQDVLVMILK